MHKRMRVELATQLLFNPRTYIRDSDLLCTPILQEILMNDPEGLGAALTSGVIMLGLRDMDRVTPVTSYSQLNELKGPEGRAFPENFPRAQAFCNFLDKSLESQGIHVALVSPGDFPRRFQTGLERLYGSPEIDQHTGDLLRAALSESIKQTEGAAVFSRMVSFLEQGRLEANRETRDYVIQMIRIAHNVADQAHTGFRISMESNDINPTLAAIAMGLPVASKEISSAVEDVAPKQILDLDDVQKINWHRLSAFHASTDGKNYFSALEQTRLVLRDFGPKSQEFRKQYVDYCQALDSYLGRIGRDGHVRLYDKQLDAVRIVLDENAVRSKRFGQSLIIGILFLSAPSGLLFMQDALGLLAAAGSLSKAAYTLGKYVHERLTDERTASARKFYESTNRYSENTILDAAR